MTASSLPARKQLGRFLHLVPDDKFIDDARDMFEEVAPGLHDYVVVSAGTTLHFIRKFRPVRLSLSQAMRPAWLARLADYRAVFVHFLTPDACQIVARAPHGTRMIWVGWGADYYHLIHERKHLLLPLTYAAVDRRHHMNCVSGGLHAARKLLEKSLRLLRRPVRSMLLFQGRVVARGGAEEIGLLNRFDLFAPVLREDYDALAAAHPDFTPRFVRWNYWTGGMGIIASLPPIPPSGNNILLGNSATPENNHLDTLDLIGDSLPPGMRILCPLSYGDRDYGDLISAAGIARYGERFVALREFLDAGDYGSLLQTCPIVAMNHIRQQGLGNVAMTLWLGAHVFMNHKSPAITALARIGIEVSDLRDLPDMLKSGFAPRSTDAIMDIRDRLARNFGRDALLIYTRELLNAS